MVEILRRPGELAGDLSKFAVRIRNTNSTTINTINTAVFVRSPLFARMQSAAALDALKAKMTNYGWFSQEAIAARKE